MGNQKSSPSSTSSSSNNKEKQQLFSTEQQQQLSCVANPLLASVAIESSLPTDAAIEEVSPPSSKLGKKSPPPNLLSGQIVRVEQGLLQGKRVPCIIDKDVKKGGEVGDGRDGCCYVDAFLGIPFAKPPITPELRFRVT